MGGTSGAYVTSIEITNYKTTVKFADHEASDTFNILSRFLWNI